jgi:hypothetical protein
MRAERPRGRLLDQHLDLRDEMLLSSLRSSREVSPKCTVSKEVRKKGETKVFVARCGRRRNGYVGVEHSGRTSDGQRRMDLQADDSDLN